jgi:hypothetical protein
MYVPDPIMTAQQPARKVADGHIDRDVEINRTMAEANAPMTATNTASKSNQTSELHRQRNSRRYIQNIAETAVISRAASTRRRPTDKWSKIPRCNGRVLDLGKRAKIQLRMVPHAKNGILRIIIDVVSCAL